MSAVCESTMRPEFGGGGWHQRPAGGIFVFLGRAGEARRRLRLPSDTPPPAECVLRMCQGLGTAERGLLAARLLQNREAEGCQRRVTPPPRQKAGGLPRERDPGATPLPCSVAWLCVL